jgi:ankyrin repeat protein
METYAVTLPSDPEAAKNIMVAISHGATLLLKAVLEHAHVDARDNKGRTALSHTAEKGQLEIAEVLLEHGASASARQWSVTGWADGRNPYRESGATPLYYATRSCHLDMVKLLLEHGANPQARTTAGGTPLAVACAFGDIEIVKLLLSKKVDVNARNYKDVCLCFSSSISLLEFPSKYSWY